MSETCNKVSQCFAVMTILPSVLLTVRRLDFILYVLARPPAILYKTGLEIWNDS